MRYSCAKYLARISALLPISFAEQLVLATIGLFGGTEDEPVVETSFGYIVDPGGTASSEGTMGFGGLESTKGEARWHGCCLALAEMARRGLIRGDEAVSQSVYWVLRVSIFIGCELHYTYTRLFSSTCGARLIPSARMSGMLLLISYGPFPVLVRPKPSNHSPERLQLA